MPPPTSLQRPHDLAHSALLSPRLVGQHQYRSLLSAPDGFVPQSWCSTTWPSLADDAYMHALDVAHLQQSETQLSDMAWPVEPSCVLGKPRIRSYALRVWNRTES